MCSRTWECLGVYSEWFGSLNIKAGRLANLTVNAFRSRGLVFKPKDARFSMSLDNFP